MSASDEPACGSDRHMVPKQRPSSIGRTQVVDLLLGAVLGEQVGVADRQERIATSVLALAAWKQAIAACATTVGQLHAADAPRRTTRRRQARFAESVQRRA